MIFATVHGDSWLFYANVVCATFLVFNIIGNLLSIILIDSSVFASDELMTRSRFKTDPTAKDWSLCEKCELVVPPRSWHCDSCGVCIVKRDHHCMFASNCVGLRNHRQFYVFLIYFFIGATYAFAYNSYFIWVLNNDTFGHWSTAIKIVLPMFMLFYGNMTELHICLYMLIVIGSALTGVLLVFHGKLIATNSTTHEKQKGTYDIGLAANLKIVFGDRWLLSLVWPFTETTLPKVYWEQRESNKSK